MSAISKDELLHFLSGYGISPRTLAVTPLEGGGGNIVLLLEADEREFVMRRYEWAAPEDVEFELRLVRLLTERMFPVQSLLARIDGSVSAPFPERPAALFEWIGGDEPTPGSPEVAASLALAIARMHTITRDAELLRAREWTDLAALDRLEDLARSRGDQITDPLWPQLIDDCRELRSILNQRVLPHDAELPKGIIHHDLHPGNLLIDPKGKVILLDFDEAQFGWFIFDLASLIRYWGMDSDWEHIDPAKLAKLLEIYSGYRPLLAVERELIPEALLLFFFGDALGFIVPALTKGPAYHAVTECHAYRRFRAVKTDLLALP